MSRVEAEQQRIAELETIRPLTVQVLEFERQVIDRVIDLCQGNMEDAAIRLGIARSTMWRKLGGKRK